MDSLILHLRPGKLDSCLHYFKFINIRPMARRVEDLALSLRLFLTDEVFSQDYSLAPVPWNEQLYTT